MVAVVMDPFTSEEGAAPDCGSAPDYVAMAEAAYDTRGTDAEWLLRLLRHMSAVLDRHQGLNAWIHLGSWPAMRIHSPVDGRRFLVARPNPHEPDVPRLPEMSSREREVLSLVAIGHADKLIGYELGLSPPSTSTLVKTGLRKLGPRSRGQLVQMFVPGASSSSRSA